MEEILFYWLHYKEWLCNSLAVCTVRAHSTVSQTPPHLSILISLFLFLSALSRAEQSTKHANSMKNSMEGVVQYSKDSIL